MSVSLAKAIHSDTDDRFYLARLCDGVKTVSHKKGWLAGSVMVGSTAVAQITTLAVSYFCLEGCVRSVIEVIHDKTPIVRVRPLGDFGGWNSLSIFSLLVMQDIFNKLIKEGEYIRLKAVCKKWIEDNKNLTIENPKFHEALYSKIIDLVDAFNSKCLFSKSLASRRLIALEIYQVADPCNTNAQFSEDKKLAQVFRSIKSDMIKQTSPTRYLNRFFEGEKTIWQRGCSNNLASQIFGIAIPIILLLNVCSSLVGEFGLGKELFIDRDELTDIGHFGEWPVNAIEAFSVAFLLHLWYVIYEGDFEITKNIYARQLEQLQTTPDLHNRLCDVANAELSQIANVIANFKLPLDYQFEKL